MVTILKNLRLKNSLIIFVPERNNKKKKEGKNPIEKIPRQ